jgi:exonuclease SbcD
VKLLVTSDWHIDAVTFGVPRRRELLAYTQKLRTVIRDEAVDVVIVAGDMFDPGGMLGSQYAADVINEFRSLAHLTRTRTLLAIAGNHDVVETDQLVTTLTPAACAFAESTADRIYVAERPTLLSFDGVSFLLLPYVARAYGERSATAFEAARQLVEQSGTEERRRLVVVGHLTIPGARMGSESHELARGRDDNFPVERIAALKPDLVFNGHYHRPQIVDVGPFEIVIPGSPLSFATDDEAQGKGFVLAEI